MSHAMTDYESGANGIAVMFYPLFHALYLGRTTPIELVWLVQLVAEMIGCKYYCHTTLVLILCRMKCGRDCTVTLYSGVCIFQLLPLNALSTSIL